MKLIVTVTAVVVRQLFPLRIILLEVLVARVRALEVPVESQAAVALYTLAVMTTTMEEALLFLVVARVARVALADQVEGAAQVERVLSLAPAILVQQVTAMTTGCPQDLLEAVPRATAARVEVKVVEAARAESLEVVAERVEVARLESLEVIAERAEVARLESLEVVAAREESPPVEAVALHIM